MISEQILPPCRRGAVCETDQVQFWLLSLTMFEHEIAEDGLQPSSNRLYIEGFALVTAPLRHLLRGEVSPT